IRELALNLANVVALPATQEEITTRTRIRRLGVVWEPTIVDPGAVARTSVFVAAAKRDPKVGAALQQILGQPHELADKPKPEPRGPCQEIEVPRAGNTVHNKYATQVTGSPYEFHINA